MKRLKMFGFFCFLSFLGAVLDEDALATFFAPFSLEDFDCLAVLFEAAPCLDPFAAACFDPFAAA